MQFNTSNTMDKFQLRHLAVILTFICICHLPMKCYAQKCVVLSDEQALAALKDGTIHNYCPPGKVKLRGSTRLQCVVVDGDGETMPFYTNCSFPLRCKSCYRINNMQVDQVCTPTQQQTCKCIDSSMIMTEDRCSFPIATTTPHVILPTSQGNITTTQENLDINECLSDPCKHDGQCVDEVNGFMCRCAPGWEGLLCLDHIGCSSSPCGHNGTCIPVGDSYICNCSTGVFGVHCDQKATEMTTVYCYVTYAVIGVAGFLIAIVIVLTCIVCYCKKGNNKAGNSDRKPQYQYNNGNGLVLYKPIVRPAVTASAIPNHLDIQPVSASEL
ncbi:uncharacterized protein [Amphiura filiformis]|uniref:uncharacterized protein n=1 Tax=Amphiura filiformis TaxID=82378 RepID=UPI003B21628B